MNFLVIAPLIMAFICFVTSLFHFVLFVRLKDDVANLAFSSTCFFVGVYDIFTFLLYSSVNLEQGITWEWAQVWEANLIAISLAWYIHNQVKGASLFILNAFAAIFGVFLILTAIIHNDWTLIAGSPEILQTGLGKWKVTYYEVPLGVLFNLEEVFLFLGFVYYLIHFFISFYKLKTRSLIPVIVSFLIFFISFINDTLVTKRVYSFIYTTEYGFMFMIMSMSWLLINRFIDLRDELVLRLYTDNLTKLPNRQRLILDIKTMQSPLLMLVDIDSFKEVNDFYGSEVGDFILVEMANRLKNICCLYPFQLYKMDGDSYGLLIELKTDEEIPVKKLAGDQTGFLFETINDKLFIHKGIEIYIRVTVGASYIRGTDHKETLIENADIALKKAKKNNKSYLMYDESKEVNQEYESNFLWSKKLREAVRDNRILSYYQPIVHNVSGAVRKFECLARIADGDGNVFEPSRFMDMSKKIRVYSKITRAVINNAICMFSGRNFEFSINLSIEDILNEETNIFLKKVLKENPDIANQMVFEILESEGICNYDLIAGFIEDIRSYGCKFAIDDFGSGYSNFDHIFKLKIDYIKIDGSIIKNLDLDRNSYIIADMIVSVSKKLNIRTVAEFVHSEEIFKKCLELGIDYSQGFYFGKPERDVAQF